MDIIHLLKDHLGIGPGFRFSFAFYNILRDDSMRRTNSKSV